MKEQFETQCAQCKRVTEKRRIYSTFKWLEVLCKDCSADYQYLTPWARKEADESNNE